MRTPDPEVEGPREAYLRRIIERQPACLARIGSDGRFLAVNDAVLSMLGAAELEQVLETPVLALVAPEHRDQCRAFFARIIAGDRGSIEVDLTGLGGLRYTVQIHAVALRSFTDSRASALCTFWDVTARRKLEGALTEAAARAQQQAVPLAARTARATAAVVPSSGAGTGSSPDLDEARLAALEAALQEAEEQRAGLIEQHAAHEAQLAAVLKSTQQQYERALAEQLARTTEVEAREQALLADRDRSQQAWRDALAKAAAEHVRSSEALQASVQALESSLTQARAREEDLVARHESQANRLEGTVARLEQQWRAAQGERDEALAGQEALRQSRDAERRALAQAAAAAASERTAAAEQLAVVASDRAALESDLRRLVAAVADGLHDALVAAARGGRRALAAIETDSAARQHADALLAGALHAAAMARRIRQGRSGAEADAAAGRVVQSLEAALGAVLAPGIEFAILVGSTDSRVDLLPDQLEQLLLTLVASRRVTMPSGGRALLEVADVHLDETCARERGIGPGTHVLFALHVSGPGVDATLPAALAGAPADEQEWRAAGPGMAGLYRTVQAAGGRLWATREGSDSIALEVYLPSVTLSMPAVPPETSR